MMGSNLLETLLNRAMPHKLPARQQFTPHLRSVVQIPHSRFGPHSIGAPSHIGPPNALNFMNNFPFKGQLPRKG